MYLVCVILWSTKYLASSELAVLGTQQIISIPGKIYGGDANTMIVVDFGLDGRIGEQVF